MDKNKKGCLWIALGVIVLLVVVGASVAGGVAWLVYQSSSLVKTQATKASAAALFDRTRARFAGQRPLVTIDDEGRSRIEPRDGHGKVPDYVSVVAWDPDDRQLARVRLPFWLMRLAGAKAQFVAGDDAMRDLTDAKLTVGDIERAGPGLVLDHQDADGRRVLVWTE